MHVQASKNYTEHFPDSPPNSSIKHYKVSNFIHGWKDSGRILDCYPNQWWPQFDFLNYSKKIMPHDKTTNSKEILEHCGRRFCNDKDKIIC